MWRLVLLSVLVSLVCGDRLLVVSIFPCANPIPGDYHALHYITAELANRGHQIEFVMFEDYVSWPVDHPNIHVRTAGKCPMNKHEETEFFSSFAATKYEDTTLPIASYFQSCTIALTNSIWNEKESIEQSLGGSIDALIIGDIFMLGPALAERFEVPFIRLHPAHLCEGGLNSISGINVHPAQTNSYFMDTSTLPVPKILQSTLNYALSHFIDYQIAKDTIKFENEYRKKMNFTLFPEENNYLYSSSHYSGDHNNQIPIATIVCNSPGFSPAVETPPFVHYVGPVIRKPVVFDSIDKKEVHKVAEWMNQDERDIIVMSLSPVARFSDETTKAIINGLGSLQKTTKVLWAIRDSVRQSLPAIVIPDNFMMVDYIPQYDILGHRNVKVFFGVGGINSLYESIVQEKPILCCPTHSEQNYNCKSIEDLEIGFRLDKNELTAELIREKASFLLQNTKAYSEPLRELKSLFLSNNGTLLAADIIEQSIRIGSNKFFLPRTVYMNYYERASLVEISVIVLTLLVIIRVIRWIVTRLFRVIFSFCSKSKKKQD